MSIATEMDAPLLALALVHARLARRPGNEDLCTQIVALQQHLEELRSAVQELERLACAGARPAGQVVNLSDRRARLHVVGAPA